MNNKTKSILIIIVVALLSGVIGFFAGQSATTKKIEEIYNEEKELSINLRRSSMEGFGDIEGKIYVVGHKQPDTDAVVSAMAYANLLRQIGYDAEAVIAGELNDETAFVLEYGNIETPKILENAAGLNIILTDHSEQLQAVDGMDEANIIAIIDHHGIGGISTGKPIIYDARPIGGASTIVWMYYRDLGIEIDKQTAYLLMSAILSDTSGLKSMTTTFADRTAIEQLSSIAGIEDPYAFYQEMYKAYISYKGMSDEEIYYSDYKEYESEGKTFAIGCVSAYDEESAKDLADRMKALFDNGLNREGIDYSYVQISIYHDDFSIIYLVPDSEEGEQLIEKGFKDKTDYKFEYDGTSIRFVPSYSRKKVLVPAIIEALKAE